MPIEVEFLNEGAFVRVMARGVVTDEEFSNYLEQLYPSDEVTRLQRYALVDWSRVTDVRISNKGIRAGAQKIIQASKIVPVGAVVAVVASSERAFGLARMWEAHVAETGWQTRVFKDLLTAEQWLEEAKKG